MKKKIFDQIYFYKLLSLQTKKFKRLQIRKKKKGKSSEKIYRVLSFTKFNFRDKSLNLLSSSKSFRRAANKF